MTNHKRPRALQLFGLWVFVAIGAVVAVALLRGGRSSSSTHAEVSNRATTVSDDPFSPRLDPTAPARRDDLTEAELAESEDHSCDVSTRNTFCKVVDEKGRPIEDAAVRFSWEDPWQEKTEGGRSSFEETLLTDKTGLAAPRRQTASEVDVHVDALGYAPLCLRWDTSADCLCVLTAALCFEGHVRDAETGDGIPGAEISWRYAGSPRRRLPFVEKTISGPSGRFEAHLPASRYWCLHANAQGYREKLVFRSVIGTQEEADGYSLDILLIPERTIHKRILLQNVRPPSLDRVTMSFTLSGERFSVAGLSESGGLELTVAPIVSKTTSDKIFLWQPDLGPLILTDAGNWLRDPEPSRAVVLDELRWLYSSFCELLFENERGEPIRSPLTLAIEAQVESIGTFGSLQMGGGTGSSDSRTLHRPDDSQTEGALEDGSGRLSQNIAIRDHVGVRDGRVELQLTPAFRRAVVHVRADGYLLQTVELAGESAGDLPAGSRTTRVITLSAATQTTEVRVLDRTNSEGIRGASLAVGVTDPGWPNFHYGREYFIGPEGASRIPLPEGAKICCVEAPDYLPMTFRLDGEGSLARLSELQIRLSRSGAVEGEVVDETGQPITGIDVEAMVLAPDENGDLQPNQFAPNSDYPGSVYGDGQRIAASIPRGYAGHATTTDNAGKFAIRGLPPDGLVRPVPIVPNFYRDDNALEVPIGTKDARLVLYRLWPLVIQFARTFPAQKAQKLQISCETVSWCLPQPIRDPNLYPVPIFADEYCLYLPRGSYRIRLIEDGSDAGIERSVTVGDGLQILRCGSVQ